MKLSDLGLKQKPQTKYFEGGYVSFSTVEGVLYYKIYKVTREYRGIIYKGMVESAEHFDQLMTIKSFNDAVRLYA